MLHRNCRKNCLILTKGPLVLIAGTTVNGNITKISSCGFITVWDLLIQ